MDSKDWLEQISSQNQIQNVLKTNSFTEKYDLELSEEEAELVVRERWNSLKEQQRIEFGEGILSKLIFEFCDSPYINRDNYAETLISLQEIFYLYKNESMDLFTDDELIEYMKNAFDNECQGSLEFLEDTVLEKLGRWARENSKAYFGSRREDDVE